MSKVETVRAALAQFDKARSVLSETIERHRLELADANEKCLNAEKAFDAVLFEQSIGERLREDQAVVKGEAAPAAPPVEPPASTASPLDKSDKETPDASPVVLNLPTADGSLAPTVVPPKAERKVESDTVTVVDVKKSRDRWVICLHDKSELLTSDEALADIATEAKVNKRKAEITYWEEGDNIYHLVSIALVEKAAKAAAKK